jgi:hypothetical protein
MVLNKLAGRSFNDLMQYPVFPFVLSNYHFPSIDLHSAHTYRCFDRPIAIQDERMKAVYAKNYARFRSLEKPSNNRNKSFVLEKLRKTCKK